MRRQVLRLLAIALAVHAGVSAAAAPLCHHSSAAAPALVRLREALAHGRFVAYQPTALKVVDGRFSNADPASIRADLEVLRGHFDSLVTYDAVHGAQDIAPIAAALKFRALIIGVWEPADATQVGAALEAARRFPQLVVGVSLGNEALFAKRADTPQLLAAIARVRAQAPQLPLTTSEPFHLFEAPPGDALLGQLDFLLVNVHPVFQPWFRGATEATAAQFVVNVAEQLARDYCGPILVKETGEPTAPASGGYSSARQASFYKELRQRLPPGPMRAFTYFAAFDAPWREQDATGVPGPHPEESHWGLFDAERRSKPAAEQLPPLPPPR
jgi:exo-beta-1,3-glucanase (GH17 family)